MEKFFLRANAVLQTCCVGSNVSLAAFAFMKRHYGQMVLPLCCTAILVGVDIMMRHLWRQRTLAMAEFQAFQQQQQAQQRQLAEVSLMGTKAVEMANQNLQIVARAVGATQCADGLTFKAGKVKFHVKYNGAYILDEDGNILQSTCIQTHPLMPNSEVMATVMLLLKNDPQIFYRWQGNPGHPYGA